MFYVPNINILCELEVTTMFYKIAEQKKKRANFLPFESSPDNKYLLKKI